MFCEGRMSIQVHEDFLKDFFKERNVRSLAEVCIRLDQECFLTYLKEF